MGSMKAIIFDVDGVLIDADYSRVEKYRRLFKTIFITEVLGKPVNIFKEEFAKIQPLIEGKEYSGVDWLVKQLDLPPGFLAEIKGRYADGIELEPKWYPAYPGVKKALEKLSKKYLLIAYSAADTKITIAKFRHNKLEKYFYEVFCGNDGDSNTKGETIGRAIGLCILEGIKPSEIAIVDDRIQAGIVIGKKYGLYRIHIKQGIHGNNEFAPDKTINSLEELI